MDGILRTGILFFLLMSLGGIGGCATIYPPARQLTDPATVFVADYGVHSSLLLPTPDGRYVEYAFGDWGYAAENKCGPQDAVGALVVSNQSALGRRFLEPRPGEVEPQPAERPWKLSKLTCERGDVYALVEQLDERYDTALLAQKPLKNPENGIEFVKVADHYSVANNCNHLTARLLQQLGCKVEGVVVSSKFNVVPPAPDAVPGFRPPREVPVPGWNTASVY